MVIFSVGHNPPDSRLCGAVTVKSYAGAGDYDPLLLLVLALVHT